MSNQRFNLSSLLFCGITLFLIFGGMCGGCAYAQTFPYRNIRVADGLPSDMVYHTLQDSKGFIWISTETGVCRFNGISFETFTTRDGLGDNEIFRSFEDTQGRIWFASTNGRFSYYYEGKFFNSGNDSTLSRMDALKKSEYPRGHIVEIFEDSRGTIWFSFRWGGIIYLSKSGEFDMLLESGYNSRGLGAILLINEDRAGNVLLIHAAGVERISPEKKVEVFLRNSETTYVWDRAIQISPDEVILIKNQSWRKLNFNSMEWKTPELTHDIIAANFIIFVGGKLWITNQEGVLKIRIEGDRWVFEDLLLPDVKISWITVDNEGNYWVSALGEGLFFVPTFSIFNLSNIPSLGHKSTTAFYLKENGDILVGMDNYYFGTLHGKHFQLDSIASRVGFNRGRTRSFYKDLSGHFWIVNENNTALYDNEKKHPVYSSFRSMVQLEENGNYIAATASGLYNISPEYMDSILSLRPDQVAERVKYFLDMKDDILTFHSINKVMKDSQNRIWLAGNNGLFIVAGDTIEEEITLPKLANRTVSDIAEDKFGNLWFAFSGYGLLKMNPDHTLKLYSTDEGLSSNFIKSIIPDTAGNIFLATTKGLNLMQYSSKGKYLINQLNARDGLLSDEVYTMVRKGDTVYVGTAKGINYFHIKEMFRTVGELPRLLVRTTPNMQEWSANVSDLVLKPNQTLGVEFIALSYRFAGNIRYRYKLIGIDDEWQSASSNRLEFPSLSSGNYSLHIEASLSGGEWNPNGASINFVVLAKYWEKWWFWLIIGLIVITIVILFYSWRFSNLKDREKLVQRAAENRQIALRSQMNPHFIFNSLNSLQRFILQNDTDSAYDYTTQFGRLVRAVLENSKFNSISLKQEIETLTLYLKLEAIRFDHRFNWEINVAPEIAIENTTIPPTLIQPFVENAIWHGLMPREGAGTVAINFTMEPPYLRIEIVDNGIGRQESAAISKNKLRMGVSSGIKITEERISALFKSSQNPPSLVISDVILEEKIAGTRVVFHIPFSSIE